jgi:hypothetical protein
MFSSLYRPNHKCFSLFLCICAESKFSCALSLYFVTLVSGRDFFHFLFVQLNSSSFCIFLLFFVFVFLFLIFFLFIVFLLKKNLLISTIVHYIHGFLIMLQLLKVSRSNVPLKFHSTTIHHSFQLCSSQVI